MYKTKDTAPATVVFDPWDTLLDASSLVELANEFFPEQGPRLCQLWRHTQAQYAMLTALRPTGSAPASAEQLRRSALEFAILSIVDDAIYTGDRAEFLLEFEPAIEMLLVQDLHLDAHPEALTLLQQLRARGVPTAVLGNADGPLLQAALGYAGLADALDGVLSAPAAGCFKPQPDAYALASAHFKHPASALLWVSAQGWDVVAAARMGHPTLWVNRNARPFETLGPQPTVSAASLHGLTPFFPPDFFTLTAEAP
jgi:2-haloacid dehalogenase